MCRRAQPVNYFFDNTPTFYTLPIHLRTITTCFLYVRDGVFKTETGFSLAILFFLSCRGCHKSIYKAFDGSMFFSVPWKVLRQPVFHGRWK